MTRRRFFLIFLIFLALTLPFLVVACGKGGDPKHPDGSVYPRKYPSR